ncbi:MAG TPA: YhdH/YhfP family quinone oxidoreductase, partial [Ignavibacteriaceae bacterium]|nr:YhdH/YhfP family quinone oxidoreductase [Ignavibacteriaceae bacterium]
SRKFKALIVKEENGKFIREITERNIDDLPDNEILINVKYSSLNYKDALSASGNKGVTRRYPHTPGIDAAGIVVESKTNKFKVGDNVLVTGYDLGMNTSGGFGEYIRVPAGWIVGIPKNLSLKESMILGTAGITAALALYRMEQVGLDKNGEVLVTGASGGVGSMAIAMFSKQGYKMVAGTGKPEQESYLKEIGAASLISREEINDGSKKALLSGRWSGVVDTVGGNILATAIASAKQWGVVAACGNVASIELHTTVFPFILRGISLLGINSEKTPIELREKIWSKLANEWKPPKLDIMYQECSLEETNTKIDAILQGKIKGRVLVNVGK